MNISSMQCIPSNYLWVEASILYLVVFQNLVLGTKDSLKIICEVNEFVTESWLLSG